MRFFLYYIDRLVLRSAQALILTGAVILSLSSLYAQNTPDFFNLGETERLDFREYTKRLFVLGHERLDANHQIERTGLLQYQSLKLQNLANDIAAIEFTNADRSKILNLEAKQLFALEQPLKDWSIEFNYSFGIEPQKLAQVYSDYKRQARDPEHTTYDDIMLRIKLEIDQKIFKLKFPVIANTLPFPGLRGTAFDYFIKTTSSEELRNLSSALLSNIREGRALNFEDYKTLLQIMQPKIAADPRALLIQYQLYLSYGQLATLSSDRPYSHADYEHHLQEVQNNMLNLASYLKLEGNLQELTTLDAVTNELVWLIYNANCISRWAPDWDSLQRVSFESNEIQNLLWVKYHFGAAWPKLLEVFQDTEFTVDTPAPYLKKILRQIDEMVEQIYPSENFYFQTAVDQIERGTWSALGPQGFAYFSLSQNLRPLLIARTFPTLNLLVGEALLTKGFFHLREEEQAKVIEQLQRGPESLLDLLKRKNNIDQHNADQVARFHVFLIDDYLKTLFPEINNEINLKSLTHIKLTHVDLTREIELPTTEALKNRMQTLIDQNRESLDYGVFIQFPFLVDWLTVNIYPDTTYWSDEWLKAKEEWAVRRERREALIETVKLHSLVEKSNEPEREKRIRDYDRALETFNTQFNERMIDENSVGVHAASFAYGLTPHDLKDIGPIAKMIGSGALFFLGSEFFGARLVIAVIASDTGLRVLSAKIFSDHDSSFLRLDLKNGFSTPLGLWTAEMLQDVLKTADTVLETPYAYERLDQFEHAGEIASSFAWFSVGAGLAHMTTDFAAISRFHRAEALKSRLRELQSQVLEKQKLAKDLKLQLSEIEKSLEVTRSEKGDASPVVRELLEKRNTLSQQIDMALNGSLPRDLKFRIQRNFLQLLRIGLTFGNPFSWMNVLSSRKLPGSNSGLIERFTKDESLGAAQFEAYIQRVNQELRALEVEGFNAESMPWLKELRSRYENWNINRRELKASRALQKMKDSLDAFKNNVKAIPNFEHAVDALSNAYVLLLKDLHSLEWFEANVKLPRNLGSREKITQTIEVKRGKVENNLRSSFGLQQKPVFDLEAGHYTEAYFSRSYLGIKRQLEVLHSLQNELINGIRRGDYPVTLDIQTRFAEIETLQQSSAAKLSRLAAKLDQYITIDSK